MPPTDLKPPADDPNPAEESDKDVPEPQDQVDLVDDDVQRQDAKCADAYGEKKGGRKGFPIVATKTLQIRTKTATTTTTATATTTTT